MNAKTNYTIMGITAVLSAAISAIGSICYIKKHLNKTMEDEKKALQKNIEESEKLLKEIPDQVDSAVRFIYDNEAKSAFERKLKTINIEELATIECQKTIKKIEDPVLRKYIRDTYSTQTRNIIEDEVKKYFKEGIKHIVDTEIDSDFIRRAAKNYIRDEAKDILEDEVERVVENSDVDEAIENYIDDNSTKFDSLIRKTITKILYEKFDDDFVDNVLQAVEDAIDDT